MQPEQNMNQASQWRLAMARKVAPVISTNPKVQAVILAGSTSRGWADSYSDIEIGVFWTTPPSDEERMAPIAVAGGVFWELDPYNPEDDIWMEEWGLAEIKMDVRNLTVERMEGILQDVVDHYDISAFKQATVSAAQYAIPLYNAPLLEQWQRKLAHYPDELARAMVQENVQLYEWCWWVDQLISRADWPQLYQSFSDATFQVFSILIGLNRIYHPGFKWMNRWIDEMQIAPPDFANRIKEIFRAEPLKALQEAQKLVLEIYDLVNKHMPEVDIQHARNKFLHWRKQFESAPEGILLDHDVAPDGHIL